MVSCHWSVSSQLSHTATFSIQYGAVWVRVVSYEDEDLVQPEEGDLVSMLSLLRTRRYGFTAPLLAHNARLDPRDPVTSAKILNRVLATMQEGVAA